MNCNYQYKVIDIKEAKKKARFKTYNINQNDKIVLDGEAVVITPKI